MTRARGRLCAALAAALAGLALTAGEPAPPAAPPARADDGASVPTGTRGGPAARPGTEFRLRWDPIGAEVPVYVPSDYDPDRRWPVVLFYHGMGGQPTTDLFRQLTGGRGAIVVGMGYTAPDKEHRSPEEARAVQAAEMAQLERMLDELPRLLRVDRARVVLAGVSKGGWHVSAFAQSGRPAVAGYVILLAGRLPQGRTDRPDLSDRAVYVGTGERDKANPYARMAVQFFERCRAVVTWEEYPDRGHEVDPAAPRLRAWVAMNLVERGESRRTQAEDWVERRLDKARDTGDPRDVYRILSGIVEDPRYNFCGDTLQAQVRALLERAGFAAEVQPEIQARRMYERALWEEQTAVSLDDLEEALDLYRQTARRFPRTGPGRLAARDADRLEVRVDDARAAARARPPRVPRPRIIIRR